MIVTLALISLSKSGKSGQKIRIPDKREMKNNLKIFKLGLSKHNMEYSIKDLKRKFG